MLPVFSPSRLEIANEFEVCVRDNITSLVYTAIQLKLISYNLQVYRALYTAFLDQLWLTYRSTYTRKPIQ